MKEFACLLVALVGLLASANARERIGAASITAATNLVEYLRQTQSLHVDRRRTLAALLARLLRFARRYYGMLDRIDWVAYYKNHGYQINSGGGMGRRPERRLVARSVRRCSSARP